MSSRLALGTVQFGLRYGIANEMGQVDRDQAGAILAHARAAAVDTLDTAIGYGESEQRLGEIGVAGWHIVSKLPRIPDSCADVSRWVHESLDGSLSRLGVPRLYGLLLHRSEELLGPNGPALHRAMLAAKEGGRVQKIGVSVYGPDELAALQSKFPLDLVQSPFNIVDRRLAESGWLHRLNESGTEVHVRSIFLQGLLLMPAAARPAKFRQWQPLWDSWHRWLQETRLTPVQACLGFALSPPEVARIVVGVDSLPQLQEILRAVDAPCTAAPRALMSDDLNLINPSRWSAN